MTTLVALALEIAIIVLLCATIIWAIRLQAALRSFRSGQAEFDAMLRRFAEAAAQADSAIRQLKAATIETGDGLNRQAERARAHLDELRLMIDSADSLAQRLEKAASGAGANAPVLQSSPARTGGDSGEPRSRAERELMLALQRETMKDAPLRAESGDRTGRRG